VMTDFGWIPSKRVLFDVRSYYKVLIPHDITHFSLGGLFGVIRLL
jgi:hypothetical protein